MANYYKIRSFRTLFSLHYNRINNWLFSSPKLFPGYELHNVMMFEYFPEGINLHIKPEGTINNGRANSPEERKWTRNWYYHLWNVFSLGIRISGRWVNRVCNVISLLFIMISVLLANCDRRNIEYKKVPGACTELYSFFTPWLTNFPLPSIADVITWAHRINSGGFGMRRRKKSSFAVALTRS